jgi:hypothetical protein
MLAKAGTRIFTPGPGAPTRESLMAAVTDHGDLYSANPNRPGAIFFETEKGRLEVNDEGAVFRPNDRSGTVRTFAGGGPGSNALNVLQIGEVIAQAQAACGNALGPAQQQTVRVLLLQPQQDLVLAQRYKSAIKSVQVNPAGATLRFAGGATVTLGPMGQVMPAGQADPPMVGRAAFGAVEALAIVSLGLAIYLLVCGVFALRRSPRAPRLLKVYAWAKVVVTIGLWVAAWWMLDDFVSRCLAASGSMEVSKLPGPVTGAAAWRAFAFLFAIAGCLVPVCLLLGLRTNAARDYYAAGRSASPG